MRIMQLLRRLILTAVVFSVAAPSAADPSDKAPGKLLFKDIYFPALVDSGENIAFFKIFEEDTVGYARLWVADPKTGDVDSLFPDIDFTRDNIQAFCFTPDGKYVALVDKILTLCDIWLHDRSNPYAEPIRVTELEQFAPDYTAEQLYQIGMSPKAVLEVKQLDISPDGKKIAMTLGIIGATSIWMYEMDRNHYRKMTPDRKGYLPKWFPDSESFVFVMADSISGKYSEDIWIMEARTNDYKPLVATRGDESFPTPSPDGKYVAYLEYLDGAWSPRVVRVSDGKVAKVFDSPYGKSCNRIIWSGDGSKLYVTIAGYDGKYSSLYEVPFDNRVLE